MIIEGYKIPHRRDKNLNRLIVASNSPHAIADRRNSDARLLVWKRAMNCPGISAAMIGDDWPLLMLSAFSMQSGWRWQIKSGSDAPVSEDRDTIMRVVESAIGVKASPRGNVTVSLPLRTYHDKSRYVGGLDWWVERVDRIDLSNPFARSFYRKLITLLRRAKAAGRNLFVEQLSMIISRDIESPGSTLTPTVHSDEFYGARETALFSLADPKSCRFQGTLFAPTVNMRSLEPHRPIDLKKMLNLLENEPIIQAKSGDLVLYDGMVSSSGEVNSSLGIPHISPDTPGSGTRMICLMRNFPNV